jgi:hypothetical protein
MTRKKITVDFITCVCYKICVKLWSRFTSAYYWMRKSQCWDIETEIQRPLIKPCLHETNNILIGLIIPYIRDRIKLTVKEVITISKFRIFWWKFNAWKLNSSIFFTVRKIISRSSFSNILFSSYLEFWMMDKVHNPSDSEMTSSLPYTRDVYSFSIHLTNNRKHQPHPSCPLKWKLSLFNHEFTSILT